MELLSTISKQILIQKNFINKAYCYLTPGAHYLEGTTDVTRVIKLNNLRF